MRLRKPALRSVLGVIAVVLVATTALILMASSSETSTPTDADIEQIQSYIDEYFSLDDFEWPPSEYGQAALAKDHVQSKNSERSVKVEKVVAGKLVEKQKAVPSFEEFANIYRAERDAIFVKTEHQLLSVESAGMTEDGQALFHVVVWYGAVKAKWNKVGKRLEDEQMTDSTPEFDIGVIQEDGVWKIASINQTIVSEDGDFEAYGPDTKHLTAMK